MIASLFSRFGRFSSRLALASALAMALGLSPLLPSGAAQAYESRYVPKADGSPLFELRFFGKGERFDEPDEETNGISTWTLSEKQKNGVIEAVRLWADTLGASSRNTSPIVINVGTFNDENASAISYSNDSDLPVVPSGMQGAIINGTAMDYPAVITIGLLDFAIAGQLSPIPSTGSWDFTGTLYHEMGHALGIANQATFNDDGVMEQISVWNSHLVDQYGNRLQPGMIIVSESEADSVEGPKFVVGDLTNSGVHFYGKHVSEVLGEGNGLLVEGNEGDYPDLSHIELEHDLMSHQSYRNYTSFMEADLAALQDIGYNFDRKNYYGFSVYGDGQTMVNENGYFARNAEGTAYLYGVPNTATLGVGLHVYGRNNTIVQAADLLACGTAGTGIRVDGSANTLTIAPGVRIAADGTWGTGLLVAYGKDQTVISRGDITALGTEGIAARFDFGNNLLGNDTEYRGSWIWNNYEDISIADSENTDLYGFPLDLDGALVSRFDVSGLLAGTDASIFISENALVKDINILSGAQVIGDIVSEWAPNNDDIQYMGDRGDLHTALTFGHAANADGTAGAPDSSFDMTLFGSVNGAKSIDMSLDAGRLAVTGTVNAYSLKNSGRLALYGMDESGKSAHLTSSFVNDKNAVLETLVSSTGKVNGIEANSAVLAGTWALRPLPEFYATGSVIRPESPVEVEYVSGDFENAVVENTSPTLDFSLSFDPEFTLTAVRDRDAYSRYAENAGARSLGGALWGISGVAEGDMQNLLAALDWSAPDGSGVSRALNALGPEAFDNAARASLNQMSEFSSLLFRHMTAAETARRAGILPDSPDAENWTLWAAPYGSGSWQSGRGGLSNWHSTGAGLMAGLDRRSDSGLTLGAHIAAGARRTFTGGSHSATAETRDFILGVQGLYAPDAWNGFYLTAQARAGVEDGDMTRNLAANGYFANNESDWTGFAFGSLIGAGKNWTWNTASGSLAAGPLAFLEWNALNRPGISERGSSASRLHLESDAFHSVPLTLGAHMAWNTATANGSTLGLDLMAGWKHELADDSFSSRASFRDYGAFGFASDTSLTGRDAMVLQSSLTLTARDNFSLQMNLGGELFRSNASAVNAGLTLGWKF